MRAAARVAARVAVCDGARTAVTISATEGDATATVWTLEGETEIRRVAFAAPGRVSGLAIDTRGRLIAASFDDARSGRGAVRVARGR